MGLAAVLMASAASAATFSGQPQFTLTPSGPVLAFERGRFGVKARSEDVPGRFAILDATDPDTADKVIAEVQLDVTGPSALTARAIDFAPGGWREQATFDAEAIAIDVVPLARGAFGVAVQAPAGFSLTLRVALPPSTTGTASADAQAPGVEGGGYAFAVSGDGAGAATGAEVTRTVATPAAAWVGFVIGVGTDVSAARAGALSPFAPPDAWYANAGAAFEAELARWSKIHTTSKMRDPLNAAAIAQLRANMTDAGMLAHKSQRNLYWLWDSTLQSLALTERSGAQALDALRIHLQSRVTDGQSPERGLLFARVDEAGVSPSLGAPSATDLFTELAPLGLPMRALQDRTHVADAVALEDLRGFYGAAGEYLEWLARRRDRDGDYRFELNGGLEYPNPDHPRFEGFAPGFDTKLPLPETTLRPALNAVDVSAWGGQLFIELARLGDRLGAPNSNAWRERGTQMMARLEDEAEGFAATDTWIDYVREGEELKRSFTRAGVYSWSPLWTGLARFPEHIVSAVEKAPAVVVNDGTLVSVDKTIDVAEVWLAAVGLYRYGYEARARAVIDALLTLLASQPNLYASYSEAGAPLGPGGSGVAAAIAVEAMRDRHQEEAFALENGGVAAQRSGHLRRLFRLTDGRLLMEVSVEGTDELPVTSIIAQTQIFSGEPMRLRFDDPDGLIGAAKIRVAFPILDEADVWIHRANGAEERRTLEASAPELEVGVGDEVELTIVRFAGERTGCGCSSGAEAMAPLAAFFWMFARIRRRRSRS